MTRIPLSTDYKTRTGAPDRDARLKNAYIETRGEQSVVRRRPSGQGGVAVGTGTAQGGIGFNIAGTDYFIGFWADTMQTYTGGGTSWNSGTNYLIGNHVSFGFVDYWALNDNINSQPPSSNWSRSYVSPVTRYSVVSGSYAASPLFSYFAGAVATPWTASGSTVNNGDGTYTFTSTTALPLQVNDITSPGGIVLTRIDDFNFKFGFDTGSSIAWGYYDTYTVTDNAVLSSNHSEISVASLVSAIQTDAMANSAAPNINTYSIKIQTTTGFRVALSGIVATATFNINGSYLDHIDGDQELIIFPASALSFTVTTTPNGTYLPLGTLLATSATGGGATTNYNYTIFPVTTS